MRVTIKDIARKVGVTPATVSMVINNSPKISQETKDRVLKAIKEMNYYPNYIGRSLVKGKTNNVAVVASFFASLFALESVRGIEFNLRKTPYNLILYSTKGIDENEEKLLERILYERRADGVIIISLTAKKELMEEYKKEGVSVVFIEELVEGVPTVKFNNIKAAFLATEYIIKKKRKNIGLIMGNKGLNAEERLHGYKEALSQYNIEFNPDLVYTVVDYSFEDGERALNALLEKNKKLDAVFCAAGDITAIGFMDAAKEKGINIPDDIGIIGFDDVYIANLTTPGLTTIRQPIIKMGMQAFNLLLEVIEGKNDGEKKIISFEPELIIRESI